MSWDLNQNQYAEFIRIWQNSNTSTEALCRLKKSDAFPSTFVPNATWHNSKPQRKEITLLHTQGIARALRDWHDIPLKCLYSEKTTNASASHIDFDCLRNIANDSAVDI